MAARADWLQQQMDGNHIRVKSSKLVDGRAHDKLISWRSCAARSSQCCMSSSSDMVTSRTRADE